MELLVVMVIILGVSVLVIPTVIHAIGSRRVDASAQLLQGALVGARDQAINANAPAGVRFLPNPANPNLLTTIVPLEIPPRYTEGLVNTFPSEIYSSAVTAWKPCLVLEEMPIYWHQDPLTNVWQPLPNPPTSWGMNIRAGDQVQIGVSHAFTVCGPIVPSDESFVSGRLQRVYTAPDGVTTYKGEPEYLQLVNGLDDNHDGFVDNGWDGIDNDGNGIIDDLPEWEAESWGSLGPQINSPYTIIRRPVPGNAAPTVLSAGVDVSQSTLPMASQSGSIDVMVRPDGLVELTSLYAAPSAVGLSQAQMRFWLGTQEDHRTITLWTKTGRIESDRDD